MSRKTYKQLVRTEELQLSDTQLPTHKPIAIYYRQSTDAQIGNISTTIQTVDMVNYLKRLGWSDERIIMIDMDAGVSGTKKIEERPGMRMLYSHITTNSIGAVACQDEDRLFRDVTQIQVNIFIEACRENRVFVITPSVVYNFAHPQMGTFHARQFRFKSEMAAEYISTIIKGKLHAAKRSLQLSGKWSGSSMPAGFMTDMRRKLSDGSENSHYRKFVPFEPYAEVVRAYFELFISYSGNRYKTLNHIRLKGPHFPDPSVCLPPEGFKFTYKIQQHKGKWYPKTMASLIHMLTNAAYIGHWIAGDCVVQWENHPGIVNEATFFEVFNYLSKFTLTGEENPNYSHVATHARPSKRAERTKEPPILSGLIFSLLNGAWRQLGTHWKNDKKTYAYVLMTDDGSDTVVWRKKASYVDATVSALLLEKLLLTFDLNNWKMAIETSFEKQDEQKRLTESQIRHLETVMRNLVTSLETLGNPQMIAMVEQRYAEAEKELNRLREELATITSGSIDSTRLLDLKASFGEILDNWGLMPSEEKRGVALVFIERIEATAMENHVVVLTIYWKDGSTDTLTLSRSASHGVFWLPQQCELLVRLVESGATKLEIAKAFPDFQWRNIYQKISTLTGKHLPVEEGVLLGKFETYNAYIQRIGDGLSSDTSDVDSSMIRSC